MEQLSVILFILLLVLCLKGRERKKDKEKIKYILSLSWYPNNHDIVPLWAVDNSAE